MAAQIGLTSGFCELVDAWSFFEHGDGARDGIDALRWCQTSS
jgi:hypothetical protein